MEQRASGLVMVDPSDPRREVWVRAEDVAAFEQRGFTRGEREPVAAAPEPAADAEEAPEPAPAAAEAEAESEAAPADDEDAADASEPEPAAEVEDQDVEPASPAVQFPRRRGRSSAPRG